MSERQELFDLHIKGQVSNPLVQAAQLLKDELARTVRISPYYCSWQDVPFPDSFYETTEDPIEFLAEKFSFISGS